MTGDDRHPPPPLRAPARKVDPGCSTTNRRREGEQKRGQRCGDGNRGQETERQRCGMETTAGMGTRDDNDDYDQARRGEGKEKTRRQDHHHNTPNRCCEQLLVGWKRGGMGIGMTGEGAGTTTEMTERGAIRHGRWGAQETSTTSPGPQVY
jgi:hypothetical protein